MLTTPLLFFFFLTNTLLKYSRDTKLKNTFAVLSRVTEVFFVLFYNSEEVRKTISIAALTVKNI